MDVIAIPVGQPPIRACHAPSVRAGSSRTAPIIVVYVPWGAPAAQMAKDSAPLALQGSLSTLLAAPVRQPTSNAPMAFLATEIIVSHAMGVARLAPHQRPNVSSVHLDRSCWKESVSRPTRMVFVKDQR